MKIAYEAPALLEYGSVTALTASGIKCSPGIDMGMQAVVGDPLDSTTWTYNDGTPVPPGTSCIPPM